MESISLFVTCDFPPDMKLSKYSAAANNEQFGSINDTWFDLGSQGLGSEGGFLYLFRWGKIVHFFVGQEAGWQTTGYSRLAG